MGHKSGGWGADESQGHKQDRDTWKVEKESAHPWSSPLDSNHQPGQQDRFAPQLARPRPQPASDATPPPKNAERWRDDGQSRFAQPAKSVPSKLCKLYTPRRLGQRLGRFY